MTIRAAIALVVIWCGASLAYAGQPLSNRAQSTSFADALLRPLRSLPHLAPRGAAVSQPNRSSRVGAPLPRPRPRPAPAEALASNSEPNSHPVAAPAPAASQSEQTGRSDPPFTAGP